MNDGISRAHSKLLFLDFDGVLHAGNASPEKRFVHVAAFASAFSSRDCGIVISSSWRFHHDWQTLVALFPSGLQRRLEGATGEAVMGRHARYREIQVWLARHPPRDWRALDDSVFEFPDNCPRLIACDGAKGIEDGEMRALEQWLGSPPSFD